MANLRLLSAIALAVAWSLAATACGSGSRRVEVPRLAGQILDARTHEPIEGVAVYQFYATLNHSILTDHTVGSRDFRWTMTDAEGRFEFPAHVVAEALRNHVDIEPTPVIRLIHREYGRPLVYVPENRSQWESVVWEIEPDARTLEDMQSTGSRCSTPCSDLDGPSYSHCYQIACGRPLPRGHGAPE